MHVVQGAKRLQSEFRYLNKQIVAGKITQMYDITPIDDNIFKWQVCPLARKPTSYKRSPHFGCLCLQDRHVG